MNNFAGRFFKCIKEDQQPNEQEAFKSTLDQGTDPSKFDVDPGSNPDVNDEVSRKQAETAEAAARQHIEQVKQIDEFATKLQDFHDFLVVNNPKTSPGQVSLVSTISQAKDDSILKSLDSQISTITRAAAALSQLITAFSSKESAEGDASFIGR